MVLDNLGGALKEVFRKITGSTHISERLITEIVKEIQRALLGADVNVKLVLDLTKKIKTRSLDEKPPSGVNAKEHVVKIVYEELVEFFGKEKQGIEVVKKKGTPFKIMNVGLFGAGKTTTIGKLAKYYSNRGNKVAVVGLDVHRPAAHTQLKQIADSLKIDSFTNGKIKDPVKLWKTFEKDLKEYDLVIVDTAGRDALSKDLVKEIEDVSKVVNPDEILLVVSADMGQAVKDQAEMFHEACGVTGVVVSKLDGTAKGGGSLSACAVTGAPIKFIGIGERPEDLEVFNPEGFVGRLLGLGDLEALLEKAKGSLDMEKAEDLSKRMLKGDFNLVDMYEQLSAMKKMGPLNKVMEMIPGMGGMKMPKGMLEGQQEKMKTWKFVLDSCTKEELETPDILGRERVERIAIGSGREVSDVRDLLKQYKQTKKMMKMMKGQNPEKMMKKFGSMAGGNFKF
ncbi:signal recognition particle protein [Candidatus Woesearchaeota archaeon]|jgi:signal recognition particle subunit SRP54|nr:signal recognition particle protein [Candidatus Woesearchaeota archaeon]MBT4731326.1 signal recognition particle protein [Candidatus Woesearchaeota archaeon]MBT5043135.1 signal recognition particle protein [Candidatus Woesearchaeota archaeon]MBT5557863.1 signal recognition particle protein [Candidatus Woesearchaeota archaeon]MBT7148848.1 signal recognition particle protein [Candidatus Woesearchaeota archaeon]